MDHTNAIPELPRLNTGIQLLETQERAIGPLHTLVLDHLLMEGGDAVWIDARNYGTSVHLANVAPSPRVLDRIHIARGFTPFQHQSLIQDAINELTGDVSLIVTPAIDAPYRSDDVRGAEPQAMLLKSLSRVSRYARYEDIPVLTTRVRNDDFSAPIGTIAADVIEVENTDFGPRFRGDDFETLVYASNGPTQQTTLAYWARILQARQPVYETSDAPETAIATAGRQ